MPVLVDFYNQHKDSIEVFSVCHTGFKDFGECAQALKDYKALDWINTVDPYYKYTDDYAIPTTPQIFLLDAEKNILMKRIGADQLEGILKEMQSRKE